MPLGPVTGIGCNCSTIPGAAVVRPRYEPALAKLPLTFALPFDDTAPASTFLATPTTSGAPQVSLLSGDGKTWAAVEDLLEEDSAFYGFIPEIDTNGIANLRFGDGTYGASPDPGLAFAATYRTGNGTAGNVGHDSLAHVLLNQPAIIRVRNPLAAAGGVDPETFSSTRPSASRHSCAASPPRTTPP
jgi:hypothetical protein